MDILAMVSTLLTILSLGRMPQWSVHVDVWGYTYVDSEGERTVPTLFVEVCNRGKDGITLYPLEYRIIPQRAAFEKYTIVPWKEHNENENKNNPRLGSGELATCEVPLPSVDPRGKPMQIEVIIKSHCGKRARKVARNHLLNYKALLIVTVGQNAEEYLKNKFPNFPV